MDPTNTQRKAHHQPGLDRREFLARSSAGLAVAGIAGAAPQASTAVNDTPSAEEPGMKKECRITLV